MIVVTTPTGRNGAQVVGKLLAEREEVRVVARHPDKLSAAMKGKVEARARPSLLDS